MMPEASETEINLFKRVSLEVRDDGAWADFVDRYAPKVYNWCRSWRLQEADAQDVTQDVLLKLTRQMSRFRYDPSRSFQGWLWTLTENAWYDWLDDRRRAVAAPGGDQLRVQMENLEDRVDLARHLAEQFDLERLEEASRRVRARVTAKTWEVYRLTAIEDLSGSEVADRLKMSVNAVFKAKSTVLKRLQDEIRSPARGC